MIDPYTILGFVGGGGLSALITNILTLKYARKSPQLDYTERLSAFWDKENKNFIDRIDRLEKRVTELEAISCTVSSCKDRKTTNV